MDKTSVEPVREQQPVHIPSADSIRMKLPIDGDIWQEKHFVFLTVVSVSVFIVVLFVILSINE